jgi:phage terminase Nu1 subunit (DNA packaging protein)
VPSENYEALDTESVADLLGVTARQVRNWVKDKGLPSKDDPRGRRFIWRDALEWYIIYRTEKDGSRGSQSAAAVPLNDPDETESLEQATTRKTIAEANLKELELATKRGQVVAIADAQRAIEVVSKNVQQKLLSVPAKLTGRLMGVADRNRIHAILEVEMKQQCTELAGISLQATKRAPEEEQ